MNQGLFYLVGIMYESLQEIINRDIKAIPDELLKIIYSEVHKEVSKRREKRKLEGRKLARLEHRNEPLQSHRRFRQLDKILAEDWSSLYPDNGGEKKYYVYCHVFSGGKKPFIGGGINFGGTPFYVGKGTGNRAYDLKRNEGHGAELRTLLSSGKKPEDIVKIVADGLTEQEAYCLEAKLICFFGTRFDGVNNGMLVNLTKPKTPYD